MTSTLEKIMSNDGNDKVINFLGIKKNEHHTLTSFNQKHFFKHEALDDFLEMDVPTHSKFILDNKGIIIKPETGEIIAFQFGRSDTAFKILNPKRYRRKYEHLKNGLLENQKPHKAKEASLHYFSNIYDDGTTVVDISELGSEWALSIYFLDQTETLVKEFYWQPETKSPLKSITKTVVVIFIIAALIALAYSLIFNPLPIFR